MSISVIIPAYNAEACVGAAIDSAVAQTLAPSEVLVVDDGSRDATAAVVDRYPAPVRCLRQANRGLPGARNTAIAQASGDWLALLDADDTWPAHHLATSISLAERTGADLVFSDARVVEPERILPSWFERSGHYWLAGQPAGAVERPYRLLLEHGSFVLPSSVLVRRTAVVAVGAFDENLRPGPEDLDLWLRLAPHTRWALNRASLIDRADSGTGLAGNGLGMAEGAEKLWTKVLHSLPASDPAERRWQARRVRRMLARAQWEQAYCHRQAGDWQRAGAAARRSLRQQWRWRAILYVLWGALPTRAPQGPAASKRA